MKTNPSKILRACMLLAGWTFSFTQAQAQLCPPGKDVACACIGNNYTCKCININNIANWMAHHDSWCGGNARMSEPTPDGSYIAVYPNPVSESATLEFYLDKPQSVSIKMYDLAGRLIYSMISAAQYGEGEYEIQWNAAAFNAGIYLLRLETGSEILSERISVVK